MSKIKIGKAGEIRNSQLITTYGPGALCDFPGVSGIIAGIDNWYIPKTDKYTCREPYLENLLNVNYFKQIIPDEEGKICHIPVYRFPKWYYCPKCGQLGKYTKISNTTKEKILYCNNCGNKKYQLNPSRFIVACANGHLNDFPYHWWLCSHCKKYHDCNSEFKYVDYKSKSENETCREPNLFIEFDNTKEGLEGILIKSETCNGKVSMAGCLSPNAFITKNEIGNYACTGEMPWLKDYNPKKSKKICLAKPRTVLRSGNNVYYPIVESAISLPDADTTLDIKEYIKMNEVKEEIDEIYTSVENYYDKQKDNNRKLRKFTREKFINTYNLLYADNTDNLIKKRQQLFKAEYNALCQSNVNDKDKNFKLEESQVPEKYTKYISKVRLVKKLREVQVLKGFSRILPEFQNDDATKKQFGIINDINKAEIYFKQKDKPQEWLPAVQLIGEGIFLELNQETIDDWVKKISSGKNQRYAQMKQTVMSDATGDKLKEKFSEQYVLLHTISHLLIRQLSYDCGYNTASIKEKIYSTLNIKDSVNTYSPDSQKMCGILIYTAATDSDGSLGGLVRLGETTNFEHLLDNMLKRAYWCSNDPVCSESKAQGYRSLNYAACHACTLLPETSCESFNSLLDRVAVIGQPGDELLETVGFFNDKLSEIDL